jgi:ribosome-associated protein
MRALKNAVVRSLSREGLKALRAEYMPGVRWAVIDYGDLIIHLFEKQTRGYYSLERLWGDAKSAQLQPEDYVQAAPKAEAGDDDEDL